MRIHKSDTWLAKNLWITLRSMLNESRFEMDFDLICELYTLNIHIYMILSAHKKKRKNLF